MDDSKKCESEKYKTLKEIKVLKMDIPHSLIG
jgi:hypothetical protein